MFKVGDIVEKYKWYSIYSPNSKQETKYNRYGGIETNVPLGTVGKVSKLGSFQGEQYCQVEFSNGQDWACAPSELKLKKEHQMLDSVKKFYEKHQDILFTIGAVLLVDYFLFNGALRSRVQTLIEKLLSSVEKKFEAKEQ